MNESEYLNEKNVRTAIESCVNLHLMFGQINHKTSLVGPYGELKTILELIIRGFKVKSEGEIRQQYDIYLGRKKARIEVRSSRLGQGRKYQWRKKGATNEANDDENNNYDFEYLVRVGFPGDILHEPFFLVHTKDDPAIQQQNVPHEEIVSRHPWIAFDKVRKEDREEEQEKEWAIFQ